MFETQSASNFEASIKHTAAPEKTVLKPLPEPLSEVAAALRKGSTNSHPPVWEPTEPQFTKAIAEYYGVSRKSVQEWFQKVKEACPWCNESDLKMPDDRYTPMTISLMGRYRTSGLPFKAWKAQIWKENPALSEQFLNVSKTEADTDTKVVPPSSIQILNSEQCSELDRLAALAESMQVYKPSQVDLNGSQDEILGLLTVVAAKVGDMEQTNLERMAALGDRKQKLATAENVLAHFINVGKGLESQAAQINDEAKEVASKESDLKKLLDAMQATLS